MEELGVGVAGLQDVEVAAAAAAPGPAALEGDAVVPADAAEEQGEGDDADGFEFGSEASDSSSWESSDEEETHEPIDRTALPAWITGRRGAASDGEDDEDDGKPTPVAASEQVTAPRVASVSASEDIRLAGTICSVVGPVVVVQAAAGEKPLNDGSVLCTEDRVPLGEVEETFGPVQAPLYAVRRCQSLTEDNALQKVEVGAKVFFVVGRSNFIDDVQKLHVKGYDASGLDDQELEEEEEFSDDEKEAEARLARRQQKRQQADGEHVLPGGAAPKPQRRSEPRPRPPQPAYHQAPPQGYPPQFQPQHPGMMWPAPPQGMWGQPMAGGWGMPAPNAPWPGMPMAWGPYGPMPGPAPGQYPLPWPAGPPPYGAWPQQPQQQPPPQ